MKRFVGAVVFVVVSAAVSWSTAQVLSPEPAAPWQFGSRMVGTSEIGGSVVLPIVDEQITVDIDGQYASTRLRQTFYNRTNNQIEGLYSLRAGLGIKAEGFAYWNGEQKIVGEVFERGVARQVYQNVTRRRRDPGLLEETSDGVFSFAVSPIQPGERKRVEVSYGQWLPRRAATVELRVPVTRADSDITVTIGDGRELREITSPTHKTEVQKLSTGRYLVRARRAVAPTQELLLHYQIVDRPWTVGGYLHRDKDQDAYFMLTLAAPELPASAAIAKDVTLVIDRSGSMMGEKMRQARAACVDIVKRLRSDDRVNVIQFDDHVEKLYNEPQPVTDANRRQVTEYIEMMDDGGATNLAFALETALRHQATGDRPRVVLFFTDGQSDVAPVFETARADTRDVRVFTVGFGPDVNRPLLARLAASKRGRFTHIPSAANIEREVSLLYHQIETPVLVDVSLETTGGAITRLYPPSLPDLFVDDELRVSGRLRASGPVTFTIKGKQGGRAVAYTARVEAPTEVKRPWVARQWAGARIADILDDIALGASRSELQSEVIDLALAYNFATPYTAFLAIPASELDPMSAHQIAGARAYKAELLRRKPDAARVTKGSGGAGSDDGSNPSPNPPRDTWTLSQNDQSPSPVSEDSEEASSDTENPLMRKNRTAMKKSQLGHRSDEGRGGCASCAVGGGGGGALATFVAAAMLLVFGFRRRRR
jgi:Ca-activated chloride channel family protein